MKRKRAKSIEKMNSIPLLPLKDIDEESSHNLVPDQQEVAKSS